MTLTELSSPAELAAFKTSNANALICYSATWCGPCRASKPQLEALAAEYAAEGVVRVAIAYEHNLGESVQADKVRAFPTYALFVDGTERGRVEGANFDQIRQMVGAAGCQKVIPGVGHSLGGGDGEAPLSPQAAREARLAKLGAPAPAPVPAAAPAPAPAPAPAEDSKPAVSAAAEDDASKDVEMKDASDAAADAAPAADADVSMADAEDKKEAEEEKEVEMVDPTESLKKEHIETLTSAMGFTLLRAQKGLLNGNGGTVEGAVEWLDQHSEDADIDEPIALVPKNAGVAQSYKCNDCGKILSSMANLELHANKTGHSDFEESTVAVKPLTAEEKKAKVAEIKALLKAKRAEREEEEKKQNIQSEKQRRFMGQEMSKTREELEREQRKREAMLRRKEKEAAKRERERLRAELAKDKLERQANKGKLKTALGADGYNPSAIQYDVGGSGDGTSPAPAKKFKADPQKIDEYIKKVSSYRAGGDGQKCLKILLAYVGNVVDKPDEEKFRTINMENKAFKTKVKPFLGAKALLVAVGFKQTEAGDALVLKEDADRDTLKETKDKLEKAYASY